MRSRGRNFTSVWIEYVSALIALLRSVSSLRANPPRDATSWGNWLRGTLSRHPLSPFLTHSNGLNLRRVGRSSSNFWSTLPLPASPARAANGPMLELGRGAFHRRQVSRLPSARRYGEGLVRFQRVARHAVLLRDSARAVPAKLLKKAEPRTGRGVQMVEAAGIEPAS